MKTILKIKRKNGLLKLGRLVMLSKLMRRNFLWFLQLLLLLWLSGGGVLKAQTISSFTVSTNTGCKPLNIQFVNTSVNAVSYTWNFGNGNTSSQASPGNPVSNPTDGFTTTYPCDVSTFSDASNVSSKKFS